MLHLVIYFKNTAPQVKIDGSYIMRFGPFSRVETDCMSKKLIGHSKRSGCWELRHIDRWSVDLDTYKDPLFDNGTRAPRCDYLNKFPV